MPPNQRKPADPLLVALARLCKEARRNVKLKQVHIAARADLDQSTIARFERAGGWPNDISKIVNAYAEELELDPWGLWQQALDEARRINGGMAG